MAVTPTGEDRPTILLDAGTGLRTVAALLDGAPFRGSLLLTHLHWDHTQGLPFFSAGDRVGSQVDVAIPAQGADALPAVDLMARAMSPPHFPIGPEGLLGDWTWRYIDVGTSWIGSLCIDAFAVRHKGGATFGYRLEDDAGSVAYVPDHQPSIDGPDPAVVERVRGAGVLLHDAQFIESEMDLAQAYGHATVEQAVELAIAAEVGHLVLFHHGPGRTDTEVDRIEAAAAAAVTATGVTVTAAREGAVIEPCPATVTSCPTHTNAPG